MIPLAIFHLKYPLVNPRRQDLYAAEDFENGEVVGKAYYLVTHGEFCKKYLGITPVGADYSFSLVTGSNAFAIDASTGIVTISNILNFTLTTIITVRCTFQGTYFEDQEINIERIPVASAVYLDPAFVGTSTGTRAQPYVRARSYPSGSRYGKTFFYKSGTTTTDEYLTMENNPGDPWTRYHRWGTGARPIVDITGQNPVNRYMNVGTTGDSPAYNISVSEIHFFNDVDHINATASYSFQIRPVARNFKMSNCSFSGNLFRHGFIWCPLSSKTLPVPYDVLNPDRMFSNLELYDYRFQDGFVDGGGRALKSEHGAIIENCIASTPFTGEVSAGISAVDMPGCHVKWCINDSSAAINNRGFNIRTAYQTYENCVSIGANDGFAIFNNNQAGYQSVDPLVGPSFPVDGTSWVKNCISIGCATAGLNFINDENTAVSPPATTVGISGLLTFNCGEGVRFRGNTRNVTVRSSILSNNTFNAVYHENGSGNKLANVTAVKNGSTDIRVGSGSLEGINVIYGTESGTFNKTTCSTNEADFVDSINDNFQLIPGSVLIGAGTHQGVFDDVIGNQFANPPSIGAYEFIAEPPPPPPVNFKTIRGLRFQLFNVLQ